MLISNTLVSVEIMWCVFNSVVMNSNVKEGHGFDLWWGLDMSLLEGIGFFLVHCSADSDRLCMQKNVLFKVAQILQCHV